MEYSACNLGDADEIIRLFITTFSDSESPTEGAMIGRLARDLMSNTGETDLYCFVARTNDQIVGSILLSRITFESGIRAFVLAPVAVRTDHQKRGVGQRLIKYGLDALSRDGVELALTYGSPAFYSKLGFHVVTEALIPPPLPLRQPEGWLAQSLSGRELEPIAGKSACVEALNKPEYW
jgi:putative acetyltransferase